MYFQPHFLSTSLKHDFIQTSFVSFELAIVFLRQLSIRAKISQDLRYLGTLWVHHLVATTKKRKFREIV
jgi:hypothetical protein